jgi:hypothetical protein
MLEMRQDEESVELADHDHKQNKDSEHGNDPLNAKLKLASDI